VCSVTVAVFAMVESPPAPRAGPGLCRALAAAGAPIVRRLAEREVHLLVGEDLAAAQDLGGIVLEEQVRQMIEADLDLLAEADHLDEVVAGPQQPRQPSRDGNAQDVDDRAVLAERDDVAL